MKTLKHPGGTTGVNDLFIGADRQLTVDTDRYELRLHDNETPGGHRILNLQQLYALFMRLDSEFGTTAFEPEGRGFLVRIGDKSYGLRQLVAGNRINISNPDGVDGDPEISWEDLPASRFIHVLTTGTNDAYKVGLPAEYLDEDGSGFIVRFHTAAVDGATISLTIGEEAEGDPIPLLNSSNTNALAGIVVLNTRALAIRSGSGYYLVGLQPLQNIPDPIEPEDPAAAQSHLWCYTEWNDYAGGNLTHTGVALANGQTKLFRMIATGTENAEATAIYRMLTRENNLHYISHDDPRAPIIKFSTFEPSVEHHPFSTQDLYSYASHWRRLGTTFSTSLTALGLTTPGVARYPQISNVGKQTSDA